jgi:hypothetical protein
MVLTGQGTDPGTGPLFVLLALSLWPRPLGSRSAPIPLHVRHATPDPQLRPALRYDVVAPTGKQGAEA